MVVKASSLLKAALAIGLAYVTLRGVHAVAPAGFTEALAMPGALFGSIGAMTGLYEIPSGIWAGVCIASNLIVYSAAWWLVIILSARIFRLNMGSHSRFAPSNTSLERTRDR